MDKDKSNSRIGTTSGHTPARRTNSWDAFLNPKKDDSEKTKQEEKEQEEESKRAKELERKQKEAEAQKKKEQDKQEDISIKRYHAASRARRLIKEFGTRDHSSLQPIEAVQLVIAERIQWLNTRVEKDEDLTEVELSAIFQQFDFLRILADKIADPEDEVAPEIEAVYQEIIEVTSDPETFNALFTGSTHTHDETPDDQVLVTLAHTLHSEDECDDIASEVDGSAEHHNHSEEIALAITSLAIACRRPRRSPLAASPGPSTGSGASAPPVSPHTQTPDAVNRPVAAQAAKEVPAEASKSYDSHSTRDIEPAVPLTLSPKEHTPTNTPYHQESVHPDLIHQETPRSTVYSYSPDRPTTSRSSVSVTEPKTFNTQPAAPVQVTRAIDLPDIPVESWPLHDMLRAAEIIPLGHGAYLRSAFAKGEISREDLVKVIKDWKKGRPYKPTFEQRKAAFAAYKAELREKSRPASTHTDKVEETVEPDTYAKSTPISPIVNTTPSQSLPNQKTTNAARTNLENAASANNHNFVTALAVILLLSIIGIILVFTL